MGQQGIEEADNQEVRKELVRAVKALYDCNFYSEKSTREKLYPYLF